MPNPAPVNTRAVPHRYLRFATLDDLEAELARIEAAHVAGALETTGNWSAGQILHHLGEFWRMAFDGFGIRAPLALRLLARLFKKRALRAPPPRGLRLRRGMRVIEPPSAVVFDDGLALLRRQVGRCRVGERMTHASPLFGSLTHEQWLSLHLNHSAMHLGFTRYPGASDA